MEKPKSIILTENAIHALNRYLGHDQIVFGLHKPEENLKEALNEGFEYLYDHKFIVDGELSQVGQEVGLYLKIMNGADYFIRFDASVFALNGPIDPIMTVGYQYLGDNQYSFSYGPRMALVAQIILSSNMLQSLNDDDTQDESWHDVDMPRFILETQSAPGIDFEIYKNYEIHEHLAFLEMDKLVQVDLLQKRVRAITPLTGRKELTRIMEVESHERTTVY